MRCEIAKRNLRLNAIRHYITEGNSTIFQFVSLWSDCEPYPIKDLVEIQKRLIADLRADLEHCPTDFLIIQIHRAELMLERIEQRQRTLEKQQARRGNNEPSNGD